MPAGSTTTSMAVSWSSGVQPGVYPDRYESADTDTPTIDSTRSPAPSAGTSIVRIFRRPSGRSVLWTWMATSVFDEAACPALTTLKLT